MKTFMTALLILSMVLVFGCSNEAKNSDNQQPVQQFEQNNETEPVTEGEIGQDDPTEQEEQDKQADPVGQNEPGEADIVETPGTFEGLSAELEARIVQDWIKLHYPNYDPNNPPPPKIVAGRELPGDYNAAFSVTVTVSIRSGKMKASAPGDSHLFFDILTK